MPPDQFRELLILRLRSAIADKEWIIARANRETHHGDFWTCDWNQGIEQAETEIQSLIQQILNYRRCPMSAPRKCPECGSELVREASSTPVLPTQCEAIWICPNVACDGYHEEE